MKQHSVKAEKGPEKQWFIHTTTKLLKLWTGELSHTTVFFQLNFMWKDLTARTLTRQEHTFPDFWKHVNPYISVQHLNKSSNNIASHPWATTSHLCCSPQPRDLNALNLHPSYPRSWHPGKAVSPTTTWPRSESPHWIRDTFLTVANNGTIYRFEDTENYCSPTFTWNSLLYTSLIYPC